MDEPIKAEYRFFAYEYDAVYVSQPPQLLFPNPSRTQRNAANSPLLHLPAELRNHIYTYVFDSATLKRDLSSTSAGRYRVECDSPRLVLVCRQIRFETRPFWNSSTYHRLTVRMESKDIVDLVEWVGLEQCKQIEQIDMFQSLAGGLQRKIRDVTAEGEWAGLWAATGNEIFLDLKRVVVTYPLEIVDNAMEVGEALQKLFGKPDLDVEFSRARFWR